MKCPNCGADRINKFNICEYCGSRLGQLNREKSKEIKETKRKEVENNIDEKARSKMMIHLALHFVSLLILLPVPFIPVIGIVICFRGLHQINNNQITKYEKTLKTSKILIFVGLGITISFYIIFFLMTL